MAEASLVLEFPPGSRVGEYDVLGLLGQGGMGTVYHGIHPQIGKRVAIKILASHYADDVEHTTRFLREAQVVNRIGHPGLVDIFSFGQLPSGHHYLVMELLKGDSLARRIEQGPFTWPEIVGIFTQILLALQAAHDAGVIHRDLKPENIFLLPGKGGGPPLVKILDFGLAKIQGGEQDMTRAGIALGTPRYMAPEQCRGKQIDHRADLYACGLTLYEAITGQFPYDSAASPMMMLSLHVSEEPQPPSRFAVLPEKLEALILRAMDKDPERRFRSAKEMAQSLCAIAPPTATVELRRRRPMSRPPLPGLTQSSRISARVTRPGEPSVGFQVTGEVAAPPPKSDPVTQIRDYEEQPTLLRSLSPVAPVPQVPHPGPVSGPVSPPPAPLVHQTLRMPPRQSVHRSPWRHAAIALLLLGLPVGLFFALRPGQKPLAAGGAGAPKPPPLLSRVEAAAPVAEQPQGAAGGVTEDPSLGSIVVETGDPEATVKLDGEARGAGHRVRIANLLPGRHKISVSAPGTQHFRKRVMVQAGTEVLLKVNLQERGPREILAPSASHHHHAHALSPSS